MTKASVREKTIGIFSGSVDLKLEILSSSSQTDGPFYEVTGLLWVTDAFPLRLYARSGTRDLLELRLSRMCCGVNQHHSLDCLTSSEQAHQAISKRRLRLSPIVDEWFDHLVSPLEAPILREEIGFFLKNTIGSRTLMEAMPGNRPDSFYAFEYTAAHALQDVRVADLRVLPPALSSRRASKWVTYELYDSRWNLNRRRSRLRKGELEILTPRSVGRTSTPTISGKAMAKLIEKHGPDLKIESEYGGFRFYLWDRAKPQRGDWPTTVSELLVASNKPW